MHGVIILVTVEEKHTVSNSKTGTQKLLILNSQKQKKHVPCHHFQVSFLKLE